jgi:retron-type reverse transcriptase
MLPAGKDRRILAQSAFGAATPAIGRTDGNERAPKVEWRQTGGTWGSPKGRNSYGDGRAIVPTLALSGYTSLTMKKRKELRHSSSITEHRPASAGLTKLEDLRNRTLRHQPVTDIYSLLLEKDLHIVAYEKLKSMPGNMTVGTDQTTLDGYSLCTLQHTIESLKNHTFRFKPSRRIYIPKPNGKTRPLGIPSPRDKLIQQVMLMILEAIYEPSHPPKRTTSHFAKEMGGGGDSDHPATAWVDLGRPACVSTNNSAQMKSDFLEVSHGFRRGRGTHTALKTIASWSGISWFLEGDIERFFDTMDHKILESLLKRRIKDQAFLDLYWKAVRAGYVEMGKYQEGMLGVPQGGVISPILSNIYLHELDLWMATKIRKSLESGKTSVPNKAYLVQHSKIHTLYRKQEKGKLEPAQIVQLQEAIKQRAQMPSTLPGQGYRIYYVRYADDFLIGINGTQQIAHKIKEEIKVFLKDQLRLTLHWDKTKITHAKDGRAHFLGADIYRPSSRTGNSKVIRKTIGTRRFKSRISATRLVLLAPIQKLVEKLADQRICEIQDYSAGKIIPIAKTSWINLPTYDIILRYRSLLNGILHYYSFAHNYSRLNWIQFLIQHSAAKLLARKLKLHSRSRAFHKFGFQLEIKENEGKRIKSINLGCRKSFRATKKFHIHMPEPFHTVYYSMRSRTLLFKECYLCNSNLQVEMHHVRSLQGKGAGFLAVMRAMNRKQIPVCKQCHMKIHRGEYDGKALAKLHSSIS